MNEKITIELTENEICILLKAIRCFSSEWGLNDEEVELQIKLEEKIGI